MNIFILNENSLVRPFSCEFCAMTFIGPTNLSQHRKRSHGDMIGESPKASTYLPSHSPALPFAIYLETKHPNRYQIGGSPKASGVPLVSGSEVKRMFTVRGVKCGKFFVVLVVEIFLDVFLDDFVDVSVSVF